MLLSDEKVIAIAPDSGATTTFNLAAGTSNKNSVAIDLTTYMGQNITLLALAGPIVSTGTLSVKLQHSTDGTTWSDVAGSSRSWDDTMSYQHQGWSITKVNYRYLRLVTTRATANSTIDRFLGIIGRCRNLPVTQLTGAAGKFVAAPVLLSSDVDGTA